MVSSVQLKALVQSHLERDDDRFVSIALQVAAHEARSGNVKLAQELRDLLTVAKRKAPRVTHAPSPTSPSEQNASSFLFESQPKNKLPDLIVKADLKLRLERVVTEQKFITKFQPLGLSARRKLLLVGASGTGKTFTASILAGELNYPLFQVRLEALITHFMGESSSNLRLVFNQINDVRGVYFFDEFDALGANRYSYNDVGEARRILNSFLQMLEQDGSNSIIVCATNEIRCLDDALFRRFDDVIRYELPQDSEISSILINRLKPYVAADFAWDRLTEIARQLSCAEIVRAADESIKDMLINQRKEITFDTVKEAVTERKKMLK